MKILATFDGTPFSESTLPVLAKMAAIPEAEFVFLSVAHVPSVRARRTGIRRPVTVSDAMGRALQVVVAPGDPVFPEDKGQAIERRVDEVCEYLETLAQRLPSGASVTVEAHVSESPAELIAERARLEEADVVVMATHGSSNLHQALFGSVAEDVVRSGVAPVLLVRPAED